MDEKQQNAKTPKDIRHGEEKLERLQAALENSEKEFKIREREAFRRGIERAVREISTVFDDFERSLANTPPEVPEAYHTGLVVL